MRGRFVTAVLALATLVAAEQSRAQQATRPAQIDRNGTLILIRSSLIALEEANETGNYTVLRDLGAPGFRDANDAARLGEIFANLRHQTVDLSGVLALDPQLTELPQIDDKGLMHMAGFFPSVPTQVNFDLAYAPVNGRWRLFGIAVRLGSSSPVAPSPPPPAVSAKLEKPDKSGAAKPKTKTKRASAPKPSGARSSVSTTKSNTTEPKPADATATDSKPETPAAGGAALDP